MARKDKRKKKAKKTSSIKRLDQLFIIIIGLVSFAIYANTFSHDYALDDFSVMKENFVVKQGAKGIPTIWKTHYRFGYWSGQGDLYRPLTLTQFALEWQIGDGSPKPSHILNVLFYTLLCIVLYLTLKKLFGNTHPIIPFLATLLFAVHPIHTEVVANIKSRDEIVSTLLCLLALLSFFRFIETNQKKFAAWGMVSFLAAFFAKESAFVFFFIIPISLYFFSSATRNQTGTTILMLVFGAIPYFLVRMSVLDGIVAGGDEAVIDNLLEGAPDFITEKATAIKILGIYALKLVWPHPLSNDYSIPEIPFSSIGDPKFLISLALYLGITIVALMRFNKKEVWVYGILVYLISLGLYSNLIFLIGSSFGERFLFIPSIGFSILVIAGLSKLLKLEQTHWEKIGDLFEGKSAIITGVVVIICIAFSLKTIDRNKAWASNFVLYETDVNNAPNSARLHYYYGLALSKDKGAKETNPTLKKQYLDKAVSEFNKAIELYPGYSDAYGQMGLAYYRQKNYDKAVESYELSLKYNKNNYTTMSNLASIFFEQGNYPQARTLYENAIKLNPRYVDALNNLASTCGMMGDLNSALKYFKESLKYEPNRPTTHHFLGITYQNMGNQQMANKHLQIAKQLNAAAGK